MTPFLKSLLMKVPAVRARKQGIEALIDERNRLAEEVRTLGDQLKALSIKQHKQKLAEEFRATGHTSRLGLHISPMENHLDKPVRDWVKYQVEAEPYWFQRIEVLPGLYSSGWVDPVLKKLPYFGLPEDLTNKRVLDIGCAEGFFSFEAERRGAREVIGIDSYPESVRRFNITKAARQSNATAFLMSVYDLEPKRLGTFDLVLFYGVFYHLKHPQYALERIRSVCTGQILFQTHVCEEPAIKGTPWARFFPHGMMSGPNNENYDPTVFWLFNSACCLAMLDHVGFMELDVISNEPQPFVVRGMSPEQAPGTPPDHIAAPWC